MKKTFLHVGFVALAAVVGIPWVCADPIIVDHTSVELYQHIPQAYIDQVKTMWLDLPGESHSKGYRIGLQLLETADSRFQVEIQESGTPAGPTNAYLRASHASWGDWSHATGWRYGYGEEDWYTSAAAIAQTKAHIIYAAQQGLGLSALGFGWCWDTTWHNGPGGTIDPTYQVRWAGSSVNGPQGDLRWGLDSGDQVLTGNSVCMDTYLDATQQYMDLCSASGFATRVFFTTGPVDGGGNVNESGLQRFLKHEHIRAYVSGTADGLLFDYADILCWGNDGTQRTDDWTDHGGTLRTFQAIHADNMLDLDGTYAEDGDHIGERGALRLAKGIWVMLARLAGWDGVPRTSQGVPHAWLDGYDLVLTTYEAAATEDADGDGLTAAEEYFADTNPTNAASVLKILSVGADEIVWLAGPSVDRPDCLVYRSTTLDDQDWGFVTNCPRHPSGTNVWTLTGAASVAPQVFYRIAVATNAP